MKELISMNDEHPLLSLMIPIADIIAKTIGDNCEVAIHDLTHPKHSIFYIVNGSLTGRKKYDGLSPAFNELVQLATLHEDNLVNYFDSENGHLFKCSKSLIRDENQHIIGCFCINIAIDNYLQMKSTIDSLCETQHIDNLNVQKTQAGNLDSNISELVHDMIINTYSELKGAKSKLSKADKIELVRFLNDKGIFRVKGTIEMVGELLKISKFTVYSYLEQIKSNSDPALISRSSS
ncbi:hypothetical protein EXM22_17145 [Oceanispirochaeta crateris]|uniref:Transcriptional regulator n=1 Tax=Oceanispirochaeta crateris TaxID=2518645 RepID=A0A5C1QNF2_9SPIO|nr:PAS domain-containing protein [Oceanispirochaeta crateris]QEN09625.1 hypothetical protein EXM22_17145 [Oceanispirochaeta crateris]